MKQLIARNINLGIHDGLSKEDEKLVKLLNYICLIWYGVTALFIVTDYFFEEKYIQLLIGYLFQVLLFISVQFLQSKRKYLAARIIFITVAFLLVVIFCNIIMPGILIELFYLLTPLFSLMFFKNKWIHYFYLVVAILTFVIPNYYLNIYPESIFRDPTTLPIFFISIFLLVNYFKSLNIKNEKLLKDQKEKALRDNELIENQKQELQDLYNFKNQFFVNIAHEIRTPLTIINGNINKLKNCDDETINNLKKQSNKITRIVKDVLDLTKMESNDFSLNMDEIHFSDFISHIFNSFHTNFQTKNIEYQLFDTTDNSIIIDADKIYLESSINNLITNAIKYTEANGKVSLIVEHLNDHIILKIKDNGIGIDEKELSAIFNRFYQSDNSINRAGGSGIGLAFSKEIITKHKGEIKVESKIDIGSTFIISLPVKSIIQTKKQSSSTPTNITIPKSELTSFAEKTILLVEDNKDMRDYIVSLLSAYTIIEAENGLEGLEKLKNEKIDYIITDYMMPKMNGYEFVKNIKANNNSLPILMLTAKTDTKTEMLRLGIDDYITKPFEEEELLIRIANGLKNYLSQQEYLKTESIPSNETIRDREATSLINELKLYIENNCTKEQFGVSDICDEFAMSQSTLFRKIKALTGLNTKAFITEVRLQKARQIINENEFIALKEISYKVGFANYTHFEKLYRERFGNTFKESPSS